MSPASSISFASWLLKAIIRCRHEDQLESIQYWISSIPMLLLWHTLILTCWLWVLVSPSSNSLQIKLFYMPNRKEGMWKIVFCQWKRSKWWTPAPTITTTRETKMWCHPSIKTTPRLTAQNYYLQQHKYPREGLLWRWCAELAKNIHNYSVCPTI